MINYFTKLVSFFTICREETGSENSLMTRQSGGLQLASLTSVWPSLTPNAKRVTLLFFLSFDITCHGHIQQVFMVIVKYQLENTESGLADYTGLSFMELYRLCRFFCHLYILGVEQAQTST